MFRWIFGYSLFTMTMNLVYQVVVSVVFWSTILSALCALIDSWSLKWFPAYAPTRFAVWVKAIGDLCDQIGNVFKDKIAPRRWEVRDERELGK